MASRGRVSRTALKIARFMLLLDSDPRLRMVLPRDTATMCEAILRGCDAVPSWQIDMMRARWAQRFYHLTEAITARGQLLWFGLRKRWLAEQVDAAIANGAHQLLVVGAGLDPLAARLAHRDPTLLAVETDTAATATAKRAGLRAADLAGANLRVVDVDLEHERLGAVIASTSWNCAAKSVVVAEGLIMYLTP
jgi:O-methyltransferase involved in polyketide biosynthesis